MKRKDVDIDEKRFELERLYNQHPPMRLLYQILIGGTIGTFLAVMIVRYIAPEKVPQITYPQQHRVKILRRIKNGQ